MRLTSGDKEIVAAINASITTQAKTVTVPVSAGDASGYQLMFASPDVTVTPTYADGSISVKLPGGSFAVFATSDVSAGVTDVQVDSADLPTYYYDLHGRRINSPSASGVYIARTGSKVCKFVRTCDGK